jgi:dienelactone hydrolase
MVANSAWLFVLSGCLVSGLSLAADRGDAVGGCGLAEDPSIRFVEVDSFDPVTMTPLKVKAKLTLPGQGKPGSCQSAQRGLPAVLLLHGSGGVDLRGDFYARALAEAGVASLELDMWEARGVTGPENRPALPAYTYPDAFAGLSFLSVYPGIDGDRVGVLGFSWGGVMSMASATEGVVALYGDGVHRFKAHAAHYPSCYAYNNPYIPKSEFGSAAGNPLTGAPILVQIGDQDDYDEGAGPCLALQSGLVESEGKLLDVSVYPGAHHAWDRLLVPLVVEDVYSHLGMGGTVEFQPDVEQAMSARRRVVSFFKRNL